MGKKESDQAVLILQQCTCAALRKGPGSAQTRASVCVQEIGCAYSQLLRVLIKCPLEPRSASEPRPAEQTGRNMTNVNLITLLQTVYLFTTCSVQKQMRLGLLRESSEPTCRILPNHLTEMSFFVFLNDWMYIKLTLTLTVLMNNSLFTVPITQKFENKQCIIKQYIDLKAHFPESAQPGSPWDICIN